eukprot:1916200-Pyramimonas_sp.AAC.1
MVAPVGIACAASLVTRALTDEVRDASVRDNADDMHETLPLRAPNPTEALGGLQESKSTFDQNRRKEVGARKILTKKPACLSWRALARTWPLEFCFLAACQCPALLPRRSCALAGWNN